MLIRSPAVLLFLISLACVSSRGAWAHPEGFSGLHITIDSNSIHAQLTIHTRDMGVWFPPKRYPDYVPQVIQALQGSSDGVLEIQINESPLRVSEVRAHQLEFGLLAVEIQYAFATPANHHAVELLIWSKHLIHLPRGHQQLVYVEDKRATTIASAEKVGAYNTQGEIVLEDVLTVERDATQTTLEITRASPSGNRRGVLSELRVDMEYGSAASPNERSKSQSESVQRSTRLSFFRFGSSTY